MVLQKVVTDTVDTNADGYAGGAIGSCQLQPGVEDRCAYAQVELLLRHGGVELHRIYAVGGVRAAGDMRAYPLQLPRSLPSVQPRSCVSTYSLISMPLLVSCSSSYLCMPAHY